MIRKATRCIGESSFSPKKTTSFCCRGVAMKAARRPFLPTHMRTSRPDICSRPLQQHPAGRISWENTSWSPSELPSQVGCAHFFRIVWGIFEGPTYPLVN